MRISHDGYPLVILSHRKREFLPDAITSLRAYAHGVTDVIVVDDSGDAEHHAWLDNHGYQLSLSSPDGSNVGYLQSMNVVWQAARRAAREAGTQHVVLWEEDFLLRKALDVERMAHVMRERPDLANLNLQRQPVYRVERRFGYMESHRKRGYEIRARSTDGVHWIERRVPFTTNPSLISLAALEIDWPTRIECDRVPGGAEPAMSEKYVRAGFSFGWLGRWNSPHTRHVGTDMKTGKGY